MVPFYFLFVLCITDGGQIGNDQSKGQIPLFNVIFEVLSAYCTVGLSMGYPNTTPALSAQFSVLGKLIICLCLWRGRHRGLPYAIDRAVLLPMDLEQHDEDQERRVKAATTLQLYQLQKSKPSVMLREQEDIIVLMIHLCLHHLHHR